MAKYRLLTTEELNELEKEFIDFLILNGIAADDWEKMKKENSEETNVIIGLFSDVVFEGIMRKVKFLEHRTKNSVKAFQCLDKKIVLAVMDAPTNNKIDFTDSDFIQKATKNAPKGLKVYTSEKEYSKTRELEIFEMITNGCTISEGQLFKTLCLVMPSKN